MNTIRNRNCTKHKSGLPRTAHAARMGAEKPISQETLSVRPLRNTNRLLQDPVNPISQPVWID
jgi:hypothetical protein